MMTIADKVTGEEENRTETERYKSYIFFMRLGLKNKLFMILILRLCLILLSSHWLRAVELGGVLG